MSEETIELNVTPTREFYYNGETAFGIYAVEPDDTEKVKVHPRFNTITIKGNCAQLEQNVSYHAKLIPQEDPKYGLTYEIKSMYEEITSKKGQRAFLTSVLSESKVNALYNAYPDQDIVELIKNDRIDPRLVSGVGQKSLKKIKEKVMANIENQKAFEHLSNYGLTNNMIVKLVAYFKSPDLLLQEMSKNPYCITRVNGIGFLKADPIAVQMGIKEDSPFRIKSAIYYVLEQEAVNNGHVYTTIDSVLDQVYELTHIDYEAISEQIKKTKGITIIDNKVGLNKYYQAEKYIANCLLDILHHSHPLPIDTDQFIAQQEAENHIKLNEEQKRILKYITTYNCALLVGYAGSGKSFTTGFVIKILDHLKMDYVLMSPTAKAAKVLSAYTGKEATTIHHAIGIKKPFQDQSKDQKIEQEFILVDEASMMDSLLCARLLNACKNPNVRILFVGDPGQLPSVNAGAVLMDLIHSQTIPTVFLTHIYRQEEGGLLDKATKVREGKVFLKHNFSGIKEYGHDLTIACVKDQNRLVSGYKYYFNLFHDKYSVDYEDITVITPTKKSVLGTVAINQEIQKIVNPPSPNKKEYLCKYSNINFREGDTVMNIKNDRKNFGIELVNGDMGKIMKIETDKKNVVILINNETVNVPFKYMKQFIQANCITVHREQGSSNKIIIFICDRSNTYILSRNLVYTAMTRATDHLVILTQAQTLNNAIKKKTDMQRRTWLKGLLVSINKTWEETKIRQR